MKRHILGLGMILLGAWSVTAYADPLPLKAVPAEAQWVAHIDVRAMRSSDLIRRFYDECIKGRAPAKLLDMVAEHWGMDPRRDLHHVTMYSTKIADGHGVMVVKAKMDKDKLLDVAKRCPTHRSMKHEDYEIHTWTHRPGGKDRQLAGVFQDTDVLVLASNPDLAKAALDVMDGRADSLQDADTPPAAQVPAGTMFLLRAMGIADSEAADKHPLCAQLDRVDYAKGQHEDQWFGHLRIDASDDDAAARIQTALKGLRAMCWLHLDAVPELQEMLDQVEFSREDNVVRSEFQAPVKELVQAVPRMREMLRKYTGERLERPKKKPVDKPKPRLKEREAKRAVIEPEGTPVLGVVIGEPLEDESPEIIRVWPDSPAEKAGLQAGDRIVKVDDQPVDSPKELRDAVGKHQPGDRVSLAVRRDDRQKSFRVRLAGADDFAGWRLRERARERQRLPRLLSPRPWLGVRVAPGTERGVTVERVIPGGPAARAGLKEGDAILRVEKTRVEAPADLQAAVAGHRPGETINLVVRRDDSRQTIRVALGAFGVWEGESDEPVRDWLRRMLEGRFPHAEDS